MLSFIFQNPNNQLGQVSAKPVAMIAFYTDTVTQTVRSLGAKFKICKCIENDAKCLKLLMLFQCYNPLLVGNLKKPTTLAENSSF